MESFLTTLSICQVAAQQDRLHPTHPEIFNEVRRCVLIPMRNTECTYAWHGFVAMPLDVQWGSTPLHHAAFTGNKDALEYLIAHGSPVNARNEVRASVLSLSVPHVVSVSSGGSHAALTLVRVHQ